MNSSSVGGDARSETALQPGSQGRTAAASPTATHSAGAGSRAGDLDRGEVLMAPGHPFNRRTGTGIKWFRPASGQPGAAQLWIRSADGASEMLAEGSHESASAREFWYSLAFRQTFPHVQNWWFGDAWTGSVLIERPQRTVNDPQSGAPMLMGYIRFGSDGDALPWNVLLLDTPVVGAPMPAMFVNSYNVPLQLLIAQKVMEVCNSASAYSVYPEELEAAQDIDFEGVLTSIVSSADLESAFPTSLGTLVLDLAPTLSPRDLLCAAFGLEDASSVVSDTAAN